MLGAVLTLIRALPHRPADLISRFAVTGYLLFRPDYRAEIRRNRALVHGDCPSWFWLVNAWRLGRNLALMARIGTSQGDAIVDTARIYGDNITLQNLEQELHMAIVSFHFGLWEYLPQVFARRGYRIRLAVGRQRDESIHNQVHKLRRSRGVRAFYGLKQAVAAFDRPGITGFVLDNTSQGNQRWVTGDGFRFRLPTLPFELAARKGARVMPAFARMERGRLRIDVGRPGDEKSVVEALLGQVRAHPEEWVFWGKAGALCG